MKTVYLLNHEASNNTWHKAYTSRDAVLTAVKVLVHEYKQDGIELENPTRDGEYFQNDFHEIFINIEELEVLS